MCINIKMLKKNWLVVGISGTTNSGKTSLANKLKENVKDTIVFYQDNYFYPENDPRHTRIPELNHNNYDILTAVDMKKLHQDILNTMDKSNSDEKQTLILDGFLIFNYKPLLDLCDLRYFLHISKDICYERRKTRNYTPPDVPGYFEKIVWPEYKKHYNEILQNEELKNTITFLDGTLPQSEIYQKVYSDVKAALSKQ